MAAGHACRRPRSLLLVCFLVLTLESVLKTPTQENKEKPLDGLHSLSETGISSNQAIREARRLKHRAKHFLSGKVLHTPNGVSTYNLRRELLACGDVSSNPGPKKTATPKYPCGECHKNVRNNQDAILCAVCNTWFHAKCLLSVY